MDKQRCARDRTTHVSIPHICGRDSDLPRSRSNRDGGLLRLRILREGCARAGHTAFSVSNRSEHAVKRRPVRNGSYPVECRERLTVDRLQCDHKPGSSPDVG
jgi:hypothetical protein